MKAIVTLAQIAVYNLLTPSGSSSAADASDSTELGLVLIRMRLLSLPGVFMGLLGAASG